MVNPKDVDLGGEEKWFQGKKERVKPIVGVNVFACVYVLDKNKWIKKN